MNTSPELDVMLEAMTEIMKEEAEKKSSPPSTPTPVLPNLSAVLARLSPLPASRLFLGMANDGLPVLLDLYDPVPGPILIAGDASTGKTRLLQTIARGIEYLFAPDAVQYGVITPTPEEWKNLYASANNAGIYHSNEENTPELIKSLVTWAHNNKGEGQSVVLFIDGLSSITKLDEETNQNLRWLLLRGPSRRVWTIVTLNSELAQNQKVWLEAFRTRLFGCIADSGNALLLTGNLPLHHLSPNNDFAMREGNQLLKFWLPTID